VGIPVLVQRVDSLVDEWDESSRGSDDCPLEVDSAGEDNEGGPVWPPRFPVSVSSTDLKNLAEELVWGVVEWTPYE